MGILLGTPKTPLERLQEQVVILKKIQREFAREADRVQGAADKAMFEAQVMRRQMGLNVGRDRIKQQLVRAEQHRQQASVYNAKAVKVGEVVTQLNLQSGDFRVQEAEQRAMAAIRWYAMRNNPRAVQHLASGYTVAMRNHDRNKEAVGTAVEFGTDVVNDADDDTAFDKDTCTSAADAIFAEWEDDELIKLRIPSKTADEDSLLLDEGDPI